MPQYSDRLILPDLTGVFFLYGSLREYKNVVKEIDFILIHAFFNCIKWIDKIVRRCVMHGNGLALLILDNHPSAPKEFYEYFSVNCTKAVNHVFGDFFFRVR